MRNKGMIRLKKDLGEERGCRCCRIRRYRSGRTDGQMLTLKVSTLGLPPFISARRNLHNEDVKRVIWAAEGKERGSAFRSHSLLSEVPIRYLDKFVPQK